MDKKQLFALFFISLAGNIVGNSMGALLPVYAAQLGASPDEIGLYLSGIFIGLAGGILVAGWLSDRLNRRKILLMAAGALAAISWAGVGRVENMGQLALISTLATFLAGIQLAMINTLAGLHAGPAERGRIFGLLASTSSIGALISGLSGAVVNRWGFTGLFIAAALVTLLEPLITLMIEEKVVDPMPRTEAFSPAPSAFSNRAFLFLFLASTLAFVGGGIFGLPARWGWRKAVLMPPPFRARWRLAV